MLIFGINSFNFQGVNTIHLTTKPNMYLSDAPTNLPACRLQHQVMKLRAEGWLEISVDFFLVSKKSTRMVVGDMLF